MENYKSRQSGANVFEVNAESISALGVLSESLADAAVFETEISENAGIITVIDETNEDSAVFVLKSVAGTIDTELISTNANITATEDNSGTINAYASGGVVVVQNLSGGAIDLRVKAIL